MSTDRSGPQWASRPTAQREGIETIPLVAFLLGSLLVLGLGTYGATFWFKREADAARQRAAEEARYPDLRQTEVHSKEKLDHYRVLSTENDLYQIPVARAMEVLAQQDTSAGTALTSEVRY